MAMRDIDHKELTATIRYEPSTGKFFRVARRYAGRIIPCVPTEIGTPRNRDGYLQMSVCGQVCVGHRLAWFYVHSEWPEVIDHINGDRADNRLANLREVTQAQNCQNIRAPKSHNKVGFLGVSWDSERGKYTAGIKAGGKRKALGRFDTPEEAHSAYLAAKRALHSHSTI